MDPPEGKKVNLEELSKEDLIKKCKTLITLAQKAKTSKEHLQEENINLKKQLDHSQQNDAAQELLERLTEEKLSLITQIDDLKSKNRRFEDKIKKYEEDSAAAQEKITTLETENVSFKRQVKRLTDENEQLISDLSSMEAQISELQKLGLEQKSQLLHLEKTNADNVQDLQSKLTVSLEEVEKLNSCLTSKKNETLELSQELQALKIISSSNKESNKNCDNCVKVLKELKARNEELLGVRNVNQKLKEKVSAYHLKLKKFASNTKEIKEEKNQIVKLFKEYTSQIQDWKEQLANVSNKLVTLVKCLEAENKKLRGNGENYSESVISKLQAEHKQEVEHLNQTLAKLERDVTELNEEINAKQVLLDEANKQQTNLKDEMEILKKQLTVATESTEGHKVLKNNLISAKEEINKLKEEIKIKCRLVDEMSENNRIIDEENKILHEKLKQLSLYENECHQLKKELASTQEVINKLNEEVNFKDNYLKQISENKEIMEKENQILLEKLKIVGQFEEKCHQLDSVNIANQQEINKLNEELKLKEKHINGLNASKAAIENDCKKLQEDLENTKKEFVDYVSKNSGENKNLNMSLISAKEEVDKLNEALKKSLDAERKLAEKSSEEILRLVQSNKELEKKCLELEDELELIKQNKSCESNFVQTDETNYREANGMDLKRENAELLAEMNQMNQALKERGENISKLEAHCEEMQNKLLLHEAQANKNVDSITEKEETIRNLSGELNNRDAEISSLKADIEALSDRCNSNYAESETMSTSTISRTEEISRLKDLEGSWEERYGKLRTLAVKLKAKIKEQNVTVADLEKEKDELCKKQAANLKTIQTLQKQIDDVQDEFEKCKAENKQYLTKLNSIAENISKDKQLLVQNEDTISKLNKEIEQLKADKQAVENWKKQVSAKVQTLRKELEAKNVMLKESESKITKLEEDLRTEQEGHKQTKSLLDQTSNECKKNSVLNLEMQDYERSVKELSLKVEKQKSEINNLQTQLDMQKSTVNALREQNKILEDRVQEEEKNGNSFSLEVAACKKTISNLEEVIQQKEDKLLDITKLLETTRSENEELSTELSKVIAEHQKSLNSIKSERDQLRHQVLGIQQNLRDTQDTLKLREDELKTIKEDYETYKVRAQSVLKKNQNRDLGLEEKLTEELSAVKSKHAELSNELIDVRKSLEGERELNAVLVKERDDLLKKAKDLETEVEEVKSYSEQLAAKHQKAISEHAETVRNLKVHAETLSQCYRQQLSDQEVRHNREIIELQSRIEKAPSPIETAPIPPGIPREEGEGSESVESSAPQNNLHPIPLERLLDSKSDDEVMHLKKNLFEQESKVSHLTALLSDTEQDLAKHVQMNKVLKEEIRRQQRSVEREQHAENLEYLKNVVFKFVTLNSGDERTRLVPVLNTILKLSPEETQKLNMVARGDPGIKAWASYLPMWPSGGKPQ